MLKLVLLLFCLTFVSLSHSSALVDSAVAKLRGARVTCTAPMATLMYLANKKNDRAAQFWLGWSLSKGKCQRVDERAAFEYKLRSAKQDYALAQYAVAQHYMTGVGVEKSLSKAQAWYKLAALSNSAVAESARIMLQSFEFSAFE